MTDRAPSATATGPTPVVRKAGPVRSNKPYLPWIAFTLALALMPVVFRSGTALTVMSLMGISIIFALSYNMLLGQTGLLSFGHAVYYGLGAYLTVHAVNWVITARLPIPLVVMPLVGGLGGLISAMLFGWLSTRRVGTAFAMITLGLGELVGSSSLILRSFFGGEEGVSTNRTRLPHIFELSFGPQIQVYYLIALWCLICAALMYVLTRTPFGRMCNAVRDNPERVQFVGYNPRVIRYIAFSLSGLFAGIAGALVGINFELANAHLFSAVQSGDVLLATFIGGPGQFFGPILGAVLVTYLQNMLSDVTELWQFYFGLLFIAAVMYAPGGLAGLIMIHRPLWRAGDLWRLLPAYALMVVPIAVVVIGVVLPIEMISHLRSHASEGSAMTLGPTTFDAASWQPWAFALACLLGGAFLSRLSWGRVSVAWAAARDAARAKGITA